jgi:hypothetical protein
MRSGVNFGATVCAKINLSNRTADEEAGEMKMAGAKPAIR